MKKIIIFGILTIVLNYSFIVLGQTTIEFETITEALNYDGDKDAVKKLIITGTISGEDYSQDSEGSKFRTFDETFPNIEAVEIWTDQNIPDLYIDDDIGYTLFATHNIGGYGTDGLKNFSAPNVIKISKEAFAYCENLTYVNIPLAETVERGAFVSCSLTYVDFPLVTAIGDNAFIDCRSLKSINFPLVTTIGNFAFGSCSSLTSVSFGTGFTEPTEINFSSYVFYTNYTKNANLILGEYVLPMPNLIENTWQNDNGFLTNEPYTGRRITVKTDINEIIKDSIVSIYPNPSTDFATIRFELEKPSNIVIYLYDLSGQPIKEIFNGFAEFGIFAKTIKLPRLPSGMYYMQISDGKTSKIEKFIIN